MPDSLSPYSDERSARAAVVSIVQELYQARLITSTGGNVSVRLRNGDRLITPTRMHKGTLTTEMLVRVQPTGQPYPGQGGPSSELPLHQAVYEAFPHVHAVVHTHAPYATALGLMGQSIPPILADALPFEQMRTVYYVVPGDRQGIEQLVDGLRDAPAVLMQNHGLLTIGHDLRQAANYALALEEVIQILTVCRIWGVEPRQLPPQDATRLRALGVV